MSEEYVAVLGAVGLMRDGVLHTPRAPLLRALLGLLAAGQVPLSPEYLMGVLWRHDPPHTPRSALHLAMSRLRNYLRANGTQIRIATTDAGYRLDAGRTDLVLFREWTAGSGASFEALSRALALWRGRPFANVPGKRCDSRLVDTLLSERRGDHPRRPRGDGPGVSGGRGRTGRAAVPCRRRRGTTSASAPGSCRSRSRKRRYRPSRSPSAPAFRVPGHRAFPACPS